ncbi:hypothetical protein BC834DRAFT_237775 [Gloeopeniophorella convolvens]|nr:hypothetical protein BC834DRAFT_237775 [Gloeopeniophorella convolvens]
MSECAASTSARYDTEQGRSHDKAEGPGRRCERAQSDEASGDFSGSWVEGAKGRKGKRWSMDAGRWSDAFSLIVVHGATSSLSSSLFQQRLALNTHQRPLALSTIPPYLTPQFHAHAGRWTVHSTRHTVPPRPLGRHRPRLTLFSPLRRRSQQLLQAQSELW